MEQFTEPPRFPNSDRAEMNDVIARLNARLNACGCTSGPHDEHCTGPKFT